MSERVERDLYPGGTPASLDAALEQYKLILGTIESLESRRQTLHTFFMSVNSLFVAAIGLLAKESLDTAEVAWGVVAFAAAGVVISMSWRLQLHSYEKVASSKWKVINAFESHMPSRPFCAEYAELQRQNYRSFTKNEAWIPVLFVVLYLVAGLVGAGQLDGLVG